VPVSSRPRRRIVKCNQRSCFTDCAGDRGSQSDWSSPRGRPTACAPAYGPVRSFHFDQRPTPLRSPQTPRDSPSCGQPIKTWVLSVRIPSHRTLTRRCTLTTFKCNYAKKQLPPMMRNPEKFCQASSKICDSADAHRNTWGRNVASALPPLRLHVGVAIGLRQIVFDMEQVKKQTFCNLSHFLCTLCTFVSPLSRHWLVKLTQLWHNSRNSRISPHQT